MTEADLPFIDTKGESAPWVITRPELVRDVITLWPIIRQGQENTLMTALTMGPFFFGHIPSPLLAAGDQKVYSLSSSILKEAGIPGSLMTGAPP